MKTIALAWFLREDYEQIKAVCADELFATFDEWEATITQRMRRFDGLGVVLEKVIVRPAELKAWADAQGIPINSNTRANFAALLMAQLEDGWLN